ncbi:hypothetical protein BDQ12DRAFT_476291 [Crucibulum laeve]|uniref:Uncharacterized protein n=1 Tax=Crucibulum laeve TaxID=68775 RepID=A0A5C3LI32_9AGAR|nr:hypothetical protein BDQ12DRAFT_476291 [Crucibulum laeve]
MPAPEILHRPHDTRPALGHVNLMIDTFIANASAEEYVSRLAIKGYKQVTRFYSLRSIARNLLATGPPGIVPAFTNAARSRLRQTNAKVVPSTSSLFRRQAHDAPSAPTQHLYDTLARARSTYGAGMGFASLGILTSIIRATVGLRWEDDGDMADILAVIDADIGQAIQSSKEEIEGGRITDFLSARRVVNDLRSALNESMTDVHSWGGEFPFERASASIQYWKL